MENREDTATRIPIITDVERFIDGHAMVRCSYFTIESEDPISQLPLASGGLRSPIVLLNLEAIVVGVADGTNRFRSAEDIEALYRYVETDRENLFIDINDIWIPSACFGAMEIKQGLLFRLPETYFSLCWKLRNDRIATDELFAASSFANIDKEDPPALFSKEETLAFRAWTHKQIEASRAQYQNNKTRALALRKKSDE